MVHLNRHTSTLLRPPAVRVGKTVVSGASLSGPDGRRFLRLDVALGTDGRRFLRQNTPSRGHEKQPGHCQRRKRNLRVHRFLLCSETHLSDFQGRM